jgi:hypothetical protein
MNTKEEILQRSEELSVHPYNVQRDYIFGWVIFGVYTISELGKYLILKG